MQIETPEFPLSIIIPLHNEERILEENLTILSGFFNIVFGSGNWLFIFVDNGSTDRTPEILKEIVKRWPPSYTIQTPEPNYGAALKAGLLAAQSRWLYIIDIDQWDLPFIAWAWKHRNSYDLFVASKRADLSINRQTAFRRLLSCALNCLLQLCFQFTGTDTHGPKLLNNASLCEVTRACQLDRGQFDTELVLRSLRGGKKVVEVPAAYREMRPARNSMVKKIFWNLQAFRRLMRVMKDVPIEGYTKYYRFSREDVLEEYSNLTLSKATAFGQADEQSNDFKIFSSTAKELR